MHLLPWLSAEALHWFKDRTTKETFEITQAEFGGWERSRSVSSIAKQLSNFQTLMYFLEVS